MRDYQKKVSKFMELAGQEIPKKPVIPDHASRVLRVRLLLEEVLEFAEASGVDIYIPSTYGRKIVDKDSDFKFEIGRNVDLCEIADSLGDINYVSYGAATTYGLDLEPFEEEIHNNNLTKISTGYKDENGKLRKGPGYVPVDLKPILDKQLSE